MLFKVEGFLGCLAICLSLTNAAHRYYWRDYMGYIPDDALGADGLYVAQVISNGVIPASFYPNTKEAVTEIHTKRVVFNNGIKLLCDAHGSTNFAWEFINVNDLTGDTVKDLVMGGSEMGSSLYIGKIFHEGQWKIGKVFPPSSEYKGLRVWNKYGDVEAFEDFQILKYVDNK